MPTRYYCKSTQNEAGTSGTPSSLGAVVDLSTTQGTLAQLGSGNTKSATFVLGKRFLVNCGARPGGAHPISVGMFMVTNSMEWRFRIHRLNNSNAIQESSAYSSAYTSAGVKTATLSLTGPFAATDRLALDIELRLTSGNQNVNFTVYVNNVNSYIDAPAALRLTADPGSANVTGIAATPKWGHKIAALAGAFAVAGVAAALGHSTASASYALDYRLAYTDSAGTPATVYSNVLTATVLPVVRASSGAFEFTGTSAALPLKMPAATGTFAVSGTDATFIKGARALIATPGAFAFTGSAATLSLPADHNKVVADSGAFSLTGRDVAFVRGQRFAGYSLDYRLVYTDSANAVVYSNTITADVMPVVRASNATFGATGTSATLTHKVGLKLSAAGGAFTTTGQDATLRRVVQDPPGSFAFTGTDASLEYGRHLDASSGAFAVSGTAATFGVLKLPCGVGAFAVTGSPVTFKIERRVWATNAQFEVAAPDATLLLSTKYMPGLAGSWAATGTPALFQITRLVRAASGTYRVTGYAASLRNDVPLSAGEGTFLVSPDATSLIYARVLPAASGAFTFAGSATSLTPSVTDAWHYPQPSAMSWVKVGAPPATTWTQDVRSNTTFVTVYPPPEGTGWS